MSISSDERAADLLRRHSLAPRGSSRPPKRSRVDPPGSAGRWGATHRAWERSGTRSLGAFRELSGDVRGGVFAEYVVVLTLLAVGAALAVVACGVPLLELYRAQVFWLSLPFP